MSAHDERVANLMADPLFAKAYKEARALIAWEQEEQADLVDAAMHRREVRCIDHCCGIHFKAE